MNLINKFQEIFKTTKSPRFFFAPGRINLIGEHTDYNGGHVFPASISFGTYALAVKRSDQKLRFYSLNIPKSGIIEFHLNETSYHKEHNWANYPKGMIHYLQQQGFAVDSGMDILFYGNIPYGAGLSSSASIEMVTGVLLENMFNLTIDRIQLVQIGKKVENDYIGVNSGIMDQFAIGMGKKDHALLLNTNTLEFAYAPLQLENHVILIMNTNKQRALAESKYNERRSQCETALANLQSELNIQDLGQLTPEQFDQHKHLIHNESNRRRAKHAVYENARTIEAYEKLQANDLQAFGKLMNESHQSLQQDYEVTGLELNTIVHAAWDQDGVLGARMTGAGFGGCAIALVEKKKAEQIINGVQAIYQAKIGYEATFYQATIGNGATEIQEDELI